MREIAFLLIMACALVAGLGASSVKPFDYPSAWKEIEKLQNDGLPKSMAEKVDSLYAAALREQKTDQQIKALIYQLTILQNVEEWSEQKAIEKVRAQINTASEPAASILHSMLAQLYWSYYQSNRYRFGERTQTVNFKQEDLATWDLKSLTKETIREYRLSLSQPELLQRFEISQYPAFVTFGGKEERLLRPTLYDFLAHQALEFYLNDESGLTQPFEEFTLSDPELFRNAGAFIKLKFATADTLSLKYQAILLFQDLTRFHLYDKDPAALIQTEVERLAYLYENCGLENAAQLYETALKELRTAYAEHPGSAFASFKLALLYRELAGKYVPEQSEDYRWHYAEALKLCLDTVDKYPQSYGGNSCRALASQLTAPELNLSVEDTVIPGKLSKTLLSLKNLSGAKLQIYRIAYDLEENTNWSEDDYQKVRALLKKKALWTRTYKLKNEEDYRPHSYELPLTNLPSGYYILIASNTADESFKANTILGFSLFNSSAISYLNSYSGDRSLLIADRNTGLPLSGALVRLYAVEYNRLIDKQISSLLWSGNSNKEGIVTIPPPERNYWNNRILITNGADSLLINRFYGYGQEGDQRLREQTLLFTDRAIYRPGQTVWLKGIVYQTDGEKQYKLLPNKPVNVIFRDVNYQEIANLKLKTTEFSTFNCSFTVPKNVLPGEMTILTGSGSISISAEEYKRPRFEVSIDNPKATFKLNQEVTVSGKALTYAGFPVDNAMLSYRVSRQPVYPRWFWWWGPSPDSAPKEIARGTGMTDAKGEFTLAFTASGDQSALRAYNPYFWFKIEVDVIDLSGETRSGTLDLSIGEKDLVLDPVIPEQIDTTLKSLQIPVLTTNLSGEPIPARGQVTISRLQAPETLMKQRLWSAPDRGYLSRRLFKIHFPNDVYMNEDQISKWKVLDTVWNGKFDSPAIDTLEIKDFGSWAPGAYLIEAVSLYQGQEVKISKYFTVFDSRAATLPYPLADWFVPLKVSCEPGEQAQLLLGSGYQDVSVLYEIEKDHKIVESRRLSLNKSQTLLSIPVLETDRGSFYVHLNYIREGRLYSHSQEITVPWTNKQISFEYMTFRDKLLPGQKEEWRIKLKDHTGGKITAEVLASMYDASLDAFRGSTWNAGIYGKVRRSKGWTLNPISNILNLNRIGYYYYDRSYPERSFDTFNWYGYYLRSGWGWNYGSGGGMRLEAIADMAAPSPMGDTGSGREIVMEKLSASAVSSTADIVSLQTGSAAAKPEDLSGVQARSNFAETAFFYPELRTDEAGDVSFVFTVPEALTKWKFRALALSKDLKIGTTENSTVTQKPLMVMPNAPRFFREGDKITFSAKLSALEDKPQTGSCQLSLFDAISMEPVDSQFKLGKASQPFSVKQGESAVLSWDLEIPFGLGAVTYRVVAKAGDFSDGEENTLPILSNRMLVTESLPLPVSGNSTKSFVFQKLKDSGKSSTIRNHRLTLEYSSNPAWYAVQALPYLMEYPYECNEQIFSRFYANSLASHIANANPRVKRVFEAWRDTPNSTALLSNLEKNQELKAVLLQETPWVLDAKNEAQSKQRIGLLFDLNNMAAQFDSALRKLQQNQSENGGWPWFPGMQDSWWVTQYIVEGFGHLDHLGVKSIREDDRVSSMLNSALDYLDSEILRDYQQILKYGRLEDDHLGYLEMHYLYARSFFKDIPLSTEVQVAVDYFRGQADKYWLDKEIYGQGLIALARHRDENKITPQKITKSLKERALHSEELGMWWKGFENGWFWYQAPIETQALMIEVFNDVLQDTASIDELRTWLLKQKQTTNWKTTKATAEACYALLLSGTEWLNTDKLAEITLGSQKIDPTKLDGVTPEAGTGYFKTSWSGSEIKPAQANIKVTNPNRVSSWGALYWQYFEDLDKITTAETPLKLKKQLFVERLTDTGKILDPISDKTQLQIGDKVIVRIELRSDRDMEYVHMKDMRSAGFEPINVLSHYKWQDGLGYYEATGDAATNFFIDYLRKGTYVFEYPLRVFNKGDFSNGITSIQCMYAPEFSSHSEGIRVKVK